MGGNSSPFFCLDPIKKFIYKPWNIGLGGAPLALDLGARKPGNKYIYIRMKAASGRKYDGLLVRSSHQITQKKMFSFGVFWYTNATKTKGYKIMGAVKEATLAVGGLSNTSKMPCKSWGISAKECKTGSKLAKIEGTICNGCYALKGAYVWPVVERAHARRLELINTSSWVENMVTAINNAPFFRWFDSGDLQNPEHLEDIVRVAIATPNTRHWLPTHEKKFVSDYMRKRGDFPDNLIVRLSAANVDGAPPKGFKLTSTSHKHGDPIGQECIAYKQDNECRDCRACWDSEVQNISYKNH